MLANGVPSCDRMSLTGISSYSRRTTLLPTNPRVSIAGINRRATGPRRFSPVTELCRTVHFIPTHIDLWCVSVRASGWVRLEVILPSLVPALYGSRLLLDPQCITNAPKSPETVKTDLSSVGMALISLGTVKDRYRAGAFWGYSGATFESCNSNRLVPHPVAIMDRTL